MDNRKMNLQIDMVVPGMGILTLSGPSAEACAGLISNWRTTGATGAKMLRQFGLLPSPKGEGWGPAHSALRSPPTLTRGDCVPTPLPQVRGNTAPKPVQPKSVAAEVAEARSALADLSRDLTRLDDVLAPMRAEEAHLRAAIVATHHQSSDGRIVALNILRRGERAPLFNRLSEIAAEWGGRKTERKNLSIHIRSLERHIEHLVRALEKERRKRSASQ